MKKKFVLFLMAVMMSFSAMCFASHGTDLDAEEKLVDQFFAGKDYNKVVSFLDPALAKDMTADRYKSMFAEMDKTLGKMTQKDLRVYQVFEDGHILRYAAKYEKMPAMEIDVVFKNEKGKFVMVDFRVIDPNAQAPAENGAEKK
ncbi:MAG: hypothetical protein IJ858_08770 [Acidaminococcaceae bacterium]|nr:hypothetical protein [Acidaminococcaceae bacterium]MBR2183500.1 hypothetical protein [Acidaminococcaceae bacterium]